jgi:molecular chaperone DnaK
MDQPSSPESNALTLRIKFKSASLEEFISRYGVDVSPGGIFIRTRQPVEVGTTLQFDFSLADGSSLLAGLGTVAWVRENDPTRANNAPGMGLRFDKLTPESQQRHQAILTEKARKEGKPQGTPYPPTAFVVAPGRQSPPPESARMPADPALRSDLTAKAEPSPANFSKTLPAPASAIAARAQDTSESGDFDAGGKTEISDKPIEELLREAEMQAEGMTKPPTPAPAERFAPDAQLDDWKTDAHTLEGETAPPAPEEVSITDSQAYATAAPVPPPSLTDSGERRPSDKNFFASMLDMDDTVEHPSENQAAAVPESAADSSGVPIAETPSEKTEEVSLHPLKTADDSADVVDLGVGASEDMVETVPPLGEIPAPQRKSGRRGALLVAGVLLAGAAAFAAVYLIQTKPWEQHGEEGQGATVLVKPKPAPVATPTPAPAPAPQPPPAPAPAEAVKPVAAEAKAMAKEEKPGAKEGKEDKGAKEAKEEKAPAKEAKEEKAPAKEAKEVKAEKPAAKEEKPVVAKPEPVKPAEEKPQEKPEAKPAVAKEEAETPKHVAKPATRASNKASSEPAGGDKTAAGVPEEEVYRLSFRSAPIGAEVLIDGEYYARTPCERRILDPKKSLAITVRKQGYEPHERMIGSSDNWVKKGNERILSIMVSLKKIKATEGESGAAAGSDEGKTTFKAAPDEPHKE